MPVKIEPAASVMGLLTQWVKVATGGRVEIRNRVTSGWQDFLVFKCSTCSANLHEGVLNFADPGIPQGVMDFCKAHRHICSRFTNKVGCAYENKDGQAVTTLCGTCDWPFEAHDQEAWMKQVKKKQDENAAVWHPPHVTYWSGTNVPTDFPAPKGHPAYKEPLQTIKTYTGRKFRDD